MLECITEQRIRWGDLDSLGIVFYPRYYEWIDACGHRFFDMAGVPIDDMWRKHRVIFGLVETGCKYFKAGRYHQAIRIVTTLTHLDSKRLTFQHLIQDARDGGLMVKGMEKRICMDVSDQENLKAVDIPADIFNVLSKMKVDNS